MHHAGRCLTFLFWSLFAVAAPCGGLLAQGEGEVAEADAAEEVDGEAKVGEDDPIAPLLAQIQQRADDKFGPVRDALQALLEQQIETATSEADRQRLERELESFEAAGILPASQPKAAREFAEARRMRLKKLQHDVRAALARGGSQGDETTARLRSALDEIEELLEQAEWTDLRCHNGFLDAMAKSGFAWDGPTLLSPTEGATLRLPSEMDRSELVSSHYEARFELERVSGDGPLRIFFPLPDRPSPDRELASVVFDDANGTWLDAMVGDRTGDLHSGQVFEVEKPSIVVMTCKHDHISVEVDGRRVIDYDGVRYMRMPAGWSKRVHNSVSFHVVTAPGTRFRVLGAGFRKVAPAPADVASRLPPVADLPEDQMWRSRVWRGRLKDGGPATVRVVRRNQLRRSAVLDVRSTKNKWHVQIVVSTDARGAKFTLESTRRLDAPVRIFDVKGHGMAGPSGLDMDWRWRNRRRGGGGAFEEGFRGN